jgi:hypothetical protein
VKKEALPVLLLAAAAAILSLRTSDVLDRGLLEGRNEDTWFDADISRAHDAMTGAGEERHERLLLHPAYGLVARATVAVFESAARLGPHAAVRAALASMAVLWIVLLFAVLRAMGCPRGDATLLGGMALSSASAVFWLGVPETYALASIGLLSALLLVAATEGRRLGDAWYSGVTALSVAFTVTNGAYGLLVTFLRRPWRRAVALALLGGGLVAALVAAQVALSPGVQLLPSGRREALFVFVPSPGRAAEVLTAATVHAMVMPRLGRVAQPRRDGGARLCLSVQSQPPGSGGRLGAVAVACWSALVGLGLWALATLKTARALRVALASGLGLELTLRSLYGPETFLAALQFLPLLVGISGLALLTPARPLALVLAGVLTVSTAVNNASRFDEAVSFYGESGRPPRLPPSP